MQHHTDARSGHGHHASCTEYWEVRISSVSVSCPERQNRRHAGASAAQASACSCTVPAADLSGGTVKTRLWRPLSYKIVPSHQSAAQVWFDCISQFHSSPDVTFLLEARDPSRQPSAVGRRSSWEDGGGHAAACHCSSDCDSPPPHSLQEGLMRCLSTPSRACILPVRAGVDDNKLLTASLLPTGLRPVIPPVGGRGESPPIPACLTQCPLPHVAGR